MKRILGQALLWRGIANRCPYQQPRRATTRSEPYCVPVTFRNNPNSKRPATKTNVRIANGQTVHSAFSRERFEACFDQAGSRVVKVMQARGTTETEQPHPAGPKESNRVYTPVLPKMVQYDTEFPELLTSKPFPQTRFRELWGQAVPVFSTPKVSVASTREMES